MENERKERERFLKMAEERVYGRQPVRGIETPSELIKSMRRSRGGKAPDVLVNVFLKKSERNYLNKLAHKLDLPSKELCSLVLKSAVVLGAGGIEIFVAAANKALVEKGRNTEKKKKRRGLNDGREEDGDEFNYEDDNEPETDGDGDERRRGTDRRQRKTGTQTGTPEEGTKL